MASENIRDVFKKSDLLLMGVCVALAAGFLVLAGLNAAEAGNFLTIDSLFFTAVCALLALTFISIPALAMRARGVNPFAVGEVSPARAAEHVHFEGGTSLFLYVLLGLLGLTVVEVFLAYKQVPLHIMLTLRERGIHPFRVGDEIPPARAAEHVHFEGGTQLFLYVLMGLLGLTVIEVFLAYIHVPLHVMLTLLIGLSLVKAAMIVAYFMHLRFERMSLVLTLIPTLAVCICLLFIVFPDSFRTRDHRGETTRAAQGQHSTGAEAPAH